MQLYIVPTPIKSYRLLGMTMDEDGFIWAGAIHGYIHRYDPRTGSVETFTLPDKSYACHCICANRKVYILGEDYPNLVILDRDTRAFRVVPYPVSNKPNVWYGTELVDDRHIYLFDRGGGGVIQWDTRSDTGTAFHFPYEGPQPGGGEYVPADGAIWLKVWDFADGKYIPKGLARFDTATQKYTGWCPFPKDDTGLQPYGDPAATLFLPRTLEGKLMPFDWKARRFCKWIDVPRYRELFGFFGGPWPHGEKLCFSLSTYMGEDLGFDGQPHHFVNAFMEFDPRGGEFKFHQIKVSPDTYHQISYMLSAGGNFFATCTNIREPDGRLVMERTGEVVFWQTVKPGK